MKSEKIVIHDLFSIAVPRYEEAAQIQRVTADDFAQWLVEIIPAHPIERVLDLGAGTGFLSRALQKVYPKIDLTLNDLSAEMLEEAQKNNPFREKTKKLIGDIETIETDERWNLIVSSFAWQWLERPQCALQRWAKQGETVAIAFPISGSFREWEELHRRLGRRSRLRALPHREEVEQWIKIIQPQDYRIHEKTYTQSVQSPLDFARQLRAMGASYPRKEQTPSALKQIEKTFPQPLNITWKVLFLRVNY